MTMRKFLVSSFWFLVLEGACLAGGFGFNQEQSLSLSGQNLFSAGITSDSGSYSILRQDRSGITLDSARAGVSSWTCIGSNLGPCVVDCVIKCNAIYDSGSNTNYDHGGIGVAYNNANNWSSLVMPNTASGGVDIRDRDNLGTEHGDDTGNVGIAINHEYRIRIDYTNATTSVSNSTINVWDNQSGTQLVTNKVHNFFSNCPTNGWLSFHTYGSSWTLVSCAIYKADGTTIVMAGPQLWAGEFGVIGNGEVGDGKLIKDSHVVQVCSDGSNTSNSSWVFDDSPVGFKDGTVVGFLTIVSGRGGGILFRDDGSGHAYYFWYDGNNAQIRLFKDPASPAAIVDGPSITLATGTEYPFTLIARGSVLSFTINGVTQTVSDSTYPGFGTIGFVGRESVINFRDVRVLP